MSKEISSTYDPTLECQSKIGAHKKTIQVWDWLVENDYRPADFSTGNVTMRRHGFVKLAKEVNNVVSVLENKLYRISAVWIDGIEVSFTEMKSKSRWTPIDNWEPIE